MYPSNREAIIIALTEYYDCDYSRVLDLLIHEEDIVGVICTALDSCEMVIADEDDIIELSSF